MNSVLSCSIFNFVASIFPSRDEKIILTFHNIPTIHYDWFRQLIVRIHKDIGFVNPHKWNNLDEEGSILLTFDDGFKSNRIVAEKILKPLGVKGMFFITHDFIGLNPAKAPQFADQYFFPSRSVSQIDGDLSAMSWGDVNWLLEQGNVVGCHTYRHSILSSLTENDQRKEIIDSADELEQKLGCKIKNFAYPFGNLSSVDEKCVETAKSRYAHAFSNIRGNVRDSPCNHFIYRQNMVPGAPCWKVYATLIGLLNFRYRKLRIKAKSTFNQMDSQDKVYS
jgi:peptidoglycan/xylan/chitin deacetylase (PgdA/CDA1 family)